MAASWYSKPCPNTRSYCCAPNCRKFSSNSGGDLVWTWLICAPSESRMRMSPAYAPPFQAWSEMAPGVRRATRNEFSESLLFAGEQARLIAMVSAKMDRWIGAVVEKLVCDLRSVRPNHCMAGLYGDC